MTATYNLLNEMQNMLSSHSLFSIKLSSLRCFLCLAKNNRSKGSRNQKNLHRNNTKNLSKNWITRQQLSRKKSNRYVARKTYYLVSFWVNDSTPDRGVVDWSNIISFTTKHQFAFLDISTRFIPRKFPV